MPEHSPRQLMPNSWRIVISCMVIWTIIANDDMITLNEFVHLYRLKESKEFGYYELVPWDRRFQLIVDLPSSFLYQKSRYFFVSGDNWENLSNDFWGDVLRLLCQWETPQLGAFCLAFFFFLVYLFILIVLSDLCLFYFILFFLFYS